MPLLGSKADPQPSMDTGEIARSPPEAEADLATTAFAVERHIHLRIADNVYDRTPVGGCKRRPSTTFGR